MGDTPFLSTGSTETGDSRLVTLDVSTLRIGATLRTPIYDNRDVLLLSPGTTLTRSLLTRLTERGTSEVCVSHSEVDAITTIVTVAERDKPTPAIPAECDIRTDHRLQRTTGAFLDDVQPRGAVDYDSQHVDEFRATYSQSVSEIEQLFFGLTQGAMKATSQFTDLSSDALSKIARDLDLFAGMGATPAVDGYPCKHSLQTAMLSLSIGSVLGLKYDELLELGVGCLIHDAGMLFVKPRIAETTRVLDRIEFLEITKHTVVMFDLMSQIPNIAHGSLMVAYQMHERCDGSGYPRGRKAGQIHHLAKISSVCDVFVALISPRPHRPGMLPYHAMEQIIHGARKGLFDHAVVRALLNTVSLFPIGSFIETTDGRVGKVLRANRELYTQPVVELWLPGTSQCETEIVDLSRASDLQVARPINELRQPKPDLQLAATLEADHWE